MTDLLESNQIFTNLFKNNVRHQRGDTDRLVWQLLSFFLQILPANYRTTSETPDLGRHLLLRIKQPNTIVAINTLSSNHLSVSPFLKHHHNTAPVSAYWQRIKSSYFFSFLTSILS
jgi:hypothetical protein